MTDPHSIKGLSTSTKESTVVAIFAIFLRVLSISTLLIVGLAYLVADAIVGNSKWFEAVQ